MNAEQLIQTVQNLKGDFEDLKMKFEERRELLDEALTWMSANKKTIEELASKAETNENKIEFIIQSVGNLAVGWEIDLAEAQKIGGAEFLGIATVMKWIADKINSKEAVKY